MAHLLHRALLAGRMCRTVRPRTARGPSPLPHAPAAYIRQASTLSEKVPIPHQLRQQPPLLTKEKWDELYQESITDPPTFWAKAARENLQWHREFHQAMDGSLSSGDIAWFAGGTLNVSENCVDRHYRKNPEKVALIYEGDDPSKIRRVTFRELHHNVCKLANAMKADGIQKGDRVCIYLPVIPEAVFAMLACARIGAVHSVVFAGFSPEALRSRILDCGAKMVITADESRRGGRHLAIKNTVDDALQGVSCVQNVYVHKSANDSRIHWTARDSWLHEKMATQRPFCEPTYVGSEDPLFVLYTSGSTGKPKGLMHTSAGYLLYSMMSHKMIFDCREGDVFASSADIGWIAGHSYIVYGPLAHGVTTCLFDSTPVHPDPSRFWRFIERHRVNSFYTAPTAVRLLMKYGTEPLEGVDLSSLRVIGCVGEPISPEAWMWLHTHPGQGRCAVVDTYWQTETGAAMLTTIPTIHEPKAGAPGFPFLGILPDVIDADGNPVAPDEEGNRRGDLVFRSAWPGLARTIFNDHERYYNTYFHHVGSTFITGDGCMMDKDGYIWISGRTDDVINKAGHRLGTAEIEAALAEHSSVAEAAVIGIPDEVKGQGICAFIILKEGEKEDDILHGSLKAEVRKHIGGLAVPDILFIVPGLPKTRSGKIMRRILRKIQAKDSNFGDVSTLAEPGIVNELVELWNAKH